MGAEAVVRGWGTWEELILGGAVLRHGTRDWNVVASELRARTLFPYAFTPEACKTKYEDLQKRYSGSTAWFEELRKQRVAELKRELAKSEDSIGSLQSRIKLLEAEKQQSNQADISSQAESPLPQLNSDGTESFSKETSKDEQSAGSFTKDTTRPKTNWFNKHPYTAAGMDTKPDCSISSEQNKCLSIKKLPDAGCGQGTTIRKRRSGQRKKKDCGRDVKEGSVEERGNLGSNNVVSTTRKETSTNDCSRTVKDSTTHIISGESCSVRGETLMDIFESVAQSEPAGVFKHRMDGQKRARYRKVIMQHLDIGLIRSRIVGKAITSVKELFRDLLLLANNALVFYSRRTREYKSALSLRQVVMKAYKEWFRWSCHEATSAFIPCNRPVKPRSARPRPRPRPPPCKDKVPEKSSNDGNIVLAMPETVEKFEDLDKKVSVHSLALEKNKKGQKRPWKSKPDLGEKRSKISPVKQRKKLRK